MARKETTIERMRRAAADPTNSLMRDAVDLVEEQAALLLDLHNTLALVEVDNKKSRILELERKIARMIEVAEE